MSHTLRGHGRWKLYKPWPVDGLEDKAMHIIWVSHVCYDHRLTHAMTCAPLKLSTQDDVLAWSSPSTLRCLKHDKLFSVWLAVDRGCPMLSAQTGTLQPIVSPTNLQILCQHQCREDLEQSKSLMEWLPILFTPGAESSVRSFTHAHGSKPICFLFHQLYYYVMQDMCTVLHILFYIILHVPDRVSGSNVSDPTVLSRWCLQLTLVFPACGTLVYMPSSAGLQHSSLLHHRPTHSHSFCSTCPSRIRSTQAGWPASVSCHAMRRQGSPTTWPTSIDQKGTNCLCII